MGPGRHTRASRQQRRRQTRAAASTCPSAAARSNRAVRAGLKVSELNAEMTVDVAIVKRELPEELAGDARDERARDEHGREHQADGDDRRRDLAPWP